MSFKSEMADSTCSEGDQLSSGSIANNISLPSLPTCSTKPKETSMATKVTIIENGELYHPNEESLEEKGEMDGISRNHQRKDSTLSDGRGDIMDIEKHSMPYMENLGRVDESEWSVKREGEGEERVIGQSPDKRFLKYDLEIGRGSFKTVYKGLDTETGVAVAWCELMENKFDKTEQARFKDEVKILKTLNNPYILRLYDSWEFTRPNDKKRVLVLITELMTSGTLKGYMKRLKSIKPRMIRGWGRQILKGLYFLHTRTPPIIHRDLKCDNIFINGTTGVVKIGDLGLATLKKSDVKTVIGTPEFMAPEMYEEQYDESVDVYAFGMCLLEMTTREYPYRECQNPAQIFKKVTNGILPQALVKIEDPALKEVIEGCIKSVKKERYVVKQLIDHEFFAEGDVKVEVVDQKDQVLNTKGDIMFRMEVPHKESKKDRQESVEFAYNLHSDVPENVVEEMIKSGILREEDRKNVIRNVREQVGTQMKRLQGHFPPLLEGVVGNNREQLEVKVQQAADSSLAPPSDVTPISTDSEGIRHPPKLQHQNSNTSDSDPMDATTMKPTPSISVREHGTEELLTTPPISIQSSPALSARNSDLTSVQEETEDEKSAESDGEEKRGTKKSKGLDRKDSHPVDVHSDEDRGRETKGEEGCGKGGRQGDGEVGLDDHSVVSKVQEITPTGEGNSTESSEVSFLHQTHSHTTNLHVDQAQDHLGGGTKKKPARGKDSKKVLRLKLTGRFTTGVVQCMLNIGEKTINFKFSTEYDKPREIFQNMLKAKHLSKNDEEEFVKRISEIVESIRKGECTLPIMEPPKGEVQRNGGSDGHTEVATHRERAGSKAPCKDEDTILEGLATTLKDQVKQTYDTTRLKSDSPTVSMATPLVRGDKKDVATSMSPVASLESRPRKKFETFDVTLSGKTPVSSQSSLDSTSTLSPVQDHTKDGFSIEPSSRTTNSPPLNIAASDSSSVTIFSKASLPFATSSSSTTPPTSILAQPSSATSSTTVITTSSRKTFEIQDVSFSAEDDYPPQEGRSRLRGDYENVSRTGLESVSSNSMQSDSHSTANGMESVPFSQIDGMPSGTATSSQASYNNPNHYPAYGAPPLNITGLDSLEHIDLPLLSPGVGKFLYYLTQILKDPDIAQLTNTLEQHYARSSMQPHYTGIPQGPPPSMHHHTTPVSMATVAQGSTHYPPPQAQSYYCESTDGDHSEDNLQELEKALEKEFEEKQRQLEQEKKRALTRLHSSRRSFVVPPSSTTNNTSEPVIPVSKTGSAGQSSHIMTTIGYQPQMNSSTISTGHLRKQANDLHPYHHPTGITAEQREGLYLATHSTPSHSPSRDMSQNPQPPQPTHPSSYPPPNMGPSVLPQSGQQQMHIMDGSYYERYPGQVQSQSPIPNQGQVPIPSQSQVPNTQNYQYVHPVYYPHHLGYQSTNGGYSTKQAHMFSSVSSYPYMPNRVPEMGQDGDHQNSITQKR